MESLLQARLELEREIRRKEEKKNKKKEKKKEKKRKKREKVAELPEVLERDVGLGKVVPIKHFIFYIMRFLPCPFCYNNMEVVNIKSVKHSWTYTYISFGKGGVDEGQRHLQGSNADDSQAAVNVDDGINKDTSSPCNNDGKCYLSPRKKYKERQS